HVSMCVCPSETSLTDTEKQRWKDWITNGTEFGNVYDEAAETEKRGISNMPVELSSSSSFLPTKRGSAMKGSKRRKCHVFMQAEPREQTDQRD
ncbi:hypothetical protein GBF38_003735, partial [Nibea albiflora]